MLGQGRIQRSRHVREGVVKVDAQPPLLAHVGQCHVLKMTGVGGELEAKGEDEGRGATCNLSRSLGSTVTLKPTGGWEEEGGAEVAAPMLNLRGWGGEGVANEPDGSLGEGEG